MKCEAADTMKANILVIDDKTDGARKTEIDLASSGEYVRLRIEYMDIYISIDDILAIIGDDGHG